MTEASLPVQAAQQARTRALVVPREHGAWGLLLVPLLNGAAVGIAAEPRVLPVVLLTVTAFALFWLRTPVESLLGTTAMKAQTAEERRSVFTVALGLGALSAACLAGLLWHGQNHGLLLLGGIAALLFIAQTFLMKLGRQWRMAAQTIGALGLTSTAAAAYYVATGHLDRRALALWAANWIFAGNQIHFVQLRIHAARAATFRDKFSQAWPFFIAQILLLPLLATTTLWLQLPSFGMAAFVLPLGRGFWWFFRQPQPLNVRKLGWSEMKQGVLFGILLTAAFIVS